MGSGVNRAKRIGHVLQVMERIERSNLAEANRVHAESVAAQDQIMASLGGDDVLTGLFVDLVAKRLKNLSSLVERQAKARDIIQAVWREKNQRAKVSGRLLDLAGAADARRAEKQDLEDLLERLHDPGMQGPGKSTARD